MGAAPQSEDAVLHRAEQMLGDRLRPWQAIDAELRNEITAAIAAPDKARPPMVAIAYPETQAELADTLALAQAENWSVLPLGSGSKLAWGGLAQPVHLGVSTARLNRLVEHAVGDLTVTAEAGTTVASLLPQLQKERQCFGFNPAYPQQATLGGAIATADTGWTRQGYGGIRDMLIGVSLVRADGQQAKAGGRVVKNVAGYDLMKLLTGSWGSLAMISEATFRIYSQPETSKTLVIMGEPSALETLLSQTLKSQLTPTGLTLVNAMTLARLGYDPASGPQAGVLVRIQSVAIGVEGQVDVLSRMANALGLLSVTVIDQVEQDLWQQLQPQHDHASVTASGGLVTAKVGLPPAAAVKTQQQLEAIAPGACSITHVSSGIGWISLDLQDAGQLAPIRALYQTQGGFLSVMVAPTDWKPTLDIWGYAGNALPLMRRIKQQFDPDNRLSPGRFLV
ncbi:MAG: FAD-binding oxidoreductase [Elainellaceae cyanobacterium]